MAQVNKGFGMPLVLCEISNPEFEYILSLAWGGGDGVIRNDGDEGQVVAEDPPSMKVEVGTFRGFISKRIARLAATETPTLTKPTNNDRIDLVQFTLGAGVNIKQGAENVSPSPPGLDSNSISFAQVYLRPGMSDIENSDNGTDGYITDIRVFI